MTERAEILARAEGGRLAVLERAWVAALSALNTETDPARLGLLARAEAEARRALEAARPKAAPATEATPAPGFGTLEEACAYLRAQGYQCSIFKLSRDHRKRGKVNRDSAGRFTQEALDAYGRAHCKLMGSGEGVDAKMARLSREKLEEEVRHRRALAERQERDNRMRAGELIERRLVERELVARGLVLKSDLLNWAHEAPPSILELVSGQMEHMHELQSYLVESLEDMLDRYADPREFVAVLTREQAGALPGAAEEEP